MNERIVVRIARNGQVEAHTEGVLGAACLNVIPMLEDLLDAAVTESRYTRDFYAVENIGTSHQQLIEEGNAG